MNIFLYAWCTINIPLSKKELRINRNRPYFLLFYKLKVMQDMTENIGECEFGELDIVDFSGDIERSDFIVKKKYCKIRKMWACVSRVIN